MLNNSLLLIQNQLSLNADEVLKDLLYELAMPPLTSSVRVNTLGSQAASERIESIKEILKEVCILLTKSILHKCSALKGVVSVVEKEVTAVIHFQ